MWEPLTCKSVLRPTGNLKVKSYREIDTVLSDNTVIVTSNNGSSDLRGVSQPTFQTEKLPKGLLLFCYVAKMARVGREVSIVSHCIFLPFAVRNPGTFSALNSAGSVSVNASV